MNSTFARRARFIILSWPLILILVALGMQSARSADAERKTFRPGKALPPPANPVAPKYAGKSDPAAHAPAEASQAVPAPQTAATAPSVPPVQEKPGEPIPLELQPYTPKGLTVFMMSNRMGEMEPCGCVKNQLGGMQYEASLLKALAPELSLRVDAGGWGVNNSNPEGVMESKFILKGMGELIGYDAVNVSGIEAGFGAKFFQEIKEKYPNAHSLLLSANIMLASDKQSPAFPTHRIVQKKLADGSEVRVAVTGVSSQPVTSAPSPGMTTASKEPDYIAVDLVNALQPVITQIKDQADFIVLLGYGSFPEMERAAKAFPEIDMIVSSSPTPDYNAKVQNVGETEVYGSFTNLGKLLGRVDFIRGEQPGHWMPVSPPVWLNVSPKTLPPVKELEDVIAEYKKTTQDLFIPVPQNMKVVFAGAQNCMECHPNEHQAWKSSRHAHAIQSLANKNSQFDPECLKCHVTGFKTDNGFYNVRDTNHMANVQCEVCHGPAYEHVTHERLIKNKTVDAMAPEQRESYLAEAKKLVPPKLVPESTCIQCHQGENDPHWNYEKKIVWVNHKPVPQEVLDALATEQAATSAEPH